jgi:acetylornithine deacetylase
MSNVEFKFKPNEQRMRARLRELVQVRSYTGSAGETEAINLVTKWLTEIESAHSSRCSLRVDRHTAQMSALRQDDAFPGTEVDRDDVPLVGATLCGTMPKSVSSDQNQNQNDENDEKPTLMLTGHIDVVPEGDVDQWIHAPFSAALVESNVVYGRGTCDMKGGLIGALEVFELFAEAGSASFYGDLVFLAVSGEEDGGVGTLAAIRRGYRADYVILAEPTGSGATLDPTLIVANAGALTCSVTVQGRSAHASKRLEGESALDHYLGIHQRLKSAERELNEAERDPLMRELVLPYPTNVGVIGGGLWASSVMDRLEVVVRVGVALGESTERAEARFRRTVADAAAHDPWLARTPPVVSVSGARFASSSIGADHPLTGALSSAAAAVFGRSPKLAAAPYGCDAALWNNVAHSPCIVYGPGDLRVAHAPNENVDLRTVDLVAQVFLQVASHLLDAPSLQRPPELGTLEDHIAAQNERLEREILLLQQQRGGSNAAASSASSSPSPSSSTTATDTATATDADATSQQTSWWRDLLKF